MDKTVFERLYAEFQKHYYNAKEFKYGIFGPKTAIFEHGYERVYVTLTLTGSIEVSPTRNPCAEIIIDMDVLTNLKNKDEQAEAFRRILQEP